MSEGLDWLGCERAACQPRTAGPSSRTIRCIRHDVTRFARGLQRTELVNAATWLGHFNGPVRLVWGTRDKHFTIELGQRLAAAFPQAQLDEVPDATTFVSIDRPDAVVSAIKDTLTKTRT